MARPLHPEHVKTRAIALAVEHGPAEAQRILAAEGHTVKPATIRSWCSRANVATVATARTRAATEAARLRWDQRRSDLCDRIGAVAEKALDVCEQNLDDGKTRAASDASAVVARLVDKAQLLSGGATGRVATDTEKRDAIAEGRARGLTLVPSERGA